MVIIENLCPKLGVEMKDFSHLDQKGNVKMVDVTDKISNNRIAKAEGRITMLSDTISAIQLDRLPKGNVLTTAKIAGIQAAKKTSELIPMCHQLNLSQIDLEFTIEPSAIIIHSSVKVKDTTGVEMEALSAVSIAALTIYDMCKAVDKTMEIGEIKLVEKIGGKTDYVTDYRPSVGIITISDSISKGEGKDTSGLILADGFQEVGCIVKHKCVLADGSEKLVTTVKNWIIDGVELIFTTGGTGLGPRDLTVEKLGGLFNSDLPGIEQALHAYGRSKVKTSMLSRLKAGLIGKTIVVCIPGSPGAAKDTLSVLIPTIFHSFHMMNSEKH